MRHHKIFSRRTRRGKLIREVREHYLRTDIHCGSELVADPTSGVGGASQSPLVAAPYHGQYLVIDTNIALHQIDLLELKRVEALCNVVILQTVLAEVKHRDIGIYNRLGAILRDESRHFFLFSNEHHSKTYAPRQEAETSNDYNDRLIRLATKWYAETLGGRVKLVLLSDDRDNRRKATAMGLTARSARAFCESIKTEFPQAMDKLALRGEDDGVDDATATGGGGSSGSSSAAATATKGLRRKYTLRKAPGLVFPAYLPDKDLQLGLQKQELHQGCFRQNPNRWQAGTVQVKLRKSKDEVAVHLTSRDHINRAVDGDIVVVRLLSDEELSSAAASVKSGAGAKTSAAADGRVEGTVVGVLKRNWHPLCGSMQRTEDAPPGAGFGGSTAMFVPRRKSFPKIRFRTRQHDVLKSKWLVVAIDEWGPHSRYPMGHYVRTLGDIGDRDVETDVILLENDIPTAPFSPQVIACLPPADWAITPQNSRGRVDLRHLDVCSIDPPGCKDIDDALHCRVLPNGNLECGVHIADVTYFVRQGTPIDDEAANRGTTTYIVQKRLDMLPGLLTETLCSVRAKVDRFVFSVIWELTPQAEVVSQRFHKSIVHSRAALTYGEAQAYLDDTRVTGAVPEAVRNLNMIAKQLRARRIAQGALTLASAEVRFQIDSETADPLAVEMYQVKDTNRLVEEFMLFANITVAKKIVEFYPSLALLRCHPVPPSSRFDRIVRVTRKLGVELNVETGKALADSLDAAAVEGKPYFNKVLRIMITRCMSQAKYFCSGEKLPEDYHHYGLAAKIYTHFTSPIRRYADVVVHRMLAAATGIEALPAAYSEKTTINDVCDNINKRNYAAQMSGRESVQMFSRIFFKGRAHVVESGIVLDCRAQGVIVLVMRYGVEGFIRLIDSDSDGGGAGDDGASADGDGGWAFDEDECEFHNRTTGETLAMFQELRVRISVEERQAYREELVLTLVRDDDGEDCGGAAAAAAAAAATGGAPSQEKRRLGKSDRVGDKKRTRKGKRT